MSEELLPKKILEKASFKGNEYAWRFKDVKDVIFASKKLHLATLGGQAQFRFPDGQICELYWIDIDIQDQKTNESWQKFVNRSADEFLEKFNNKILKVNFLKEAKSNEFLKTKIKNNINIVKNLYFVIYIVDKNKYDLLKKNKQK